MDSTLVSSTSQVSTQTSKNSSPYPYATQPVTLNPNSNTGVNPGSLQFGLGWLTLTFRKPLDTESDAYSRHISKLYEGLTKDFFVKESFGFNSYQSSRRYRSGAFLAWSADRDDMCLCLPQAALDRLTPRVLARTVYKLNALDGVNVTRLDVYYDDYSRVISPAVVLAALQAGLHPSKSVQYKIIQAWTKDTLESDTIYIGSQHSDFYVRVYDKGLESQGKQDCNRLEFQLRGATANAFFAQFIYHPFTDWGKHTFLMLLAKFDFVHRIGPRGDKTKRRLDWWHKLVSSAAAIPWRVQQIKAKLLSTIAWAEDVLPTTLHMLQSVFGTEGLATWAGKLLKLGAGKIRRKHSGMMQEYIEQMRISVPS